MTRRLWIALQCCSEKTIDVICIELSQLRTHFKRNFEQRFQQINQDPVALDGRSFESKAISRAPDGAEAGRKWNVFALKETTPVFVCNRKQKAVDVHQEYLPDKAKASRATQHQINKSPRRSPWNLRRASVWI